MTLTELEKEVSTAIGKAFECNVSPNDVIVSLQIYGPGAESELLGVCF
jgi:hypothetical protein